MYVLEHGVDPGNWDMLHTCDNPGCVNPEHLFLGTPQDNSDQRADRGRFVASKGNTKIGPKEHQEICDSNEPVNMLAARYGVTRKAIWEHRSGRVRPDEAA
jgi:hypothetical protein